MRGSVVEADTRGCGAVLSVRLTTGPCGPQDYSCTAHSEQRCLEGRLLRSVWRSARMSRGRSQPTARLGSTHGGHLSKLSGVYVEAPQSCSSALGLDVAVGDDNKSVARGCSGNFASVAQGLRTSCSQGPSMPPRTAREGETREEGNERDAPEQQRLEM